MRAGIGFDAHRFGGEGPLVLGGVVVDGDRGVEATSDGDVVAHAVADALLGAAALGDLGHHFPEATSHGLDSLEAIEQVVAMLGEVGASPHNVDVTVISQSVRIAPHRDEMEQRIASALGVERGQVSIKATTTDLMGAIGRDEGVAVLATATVV
ncbi:MAG: 2-C-methyl-D-erythritol 2,4-cyclodiphosphate synthase [Acidimicrobiia bacterium]|nr:2-C-methyl-D-erythritol 2,4-cyclodiphosphate synthase [Acidimicrobiia bacterium]NNK92166.1 2-C-methyl-D-erythritol 2,4-cyclodiphosphate synthase [Acidimicrobiia bacterium]